MATGCLNLAKEHLRTMLAAVTAFQTLVDADDAIEAAESIHYDGLPRPAGPENTYLEEEFESYHPCAILFTAPAGGFRKVVYNDTQASGKLIIRIYKMADAEEVVDGEPTAAEKTEFEDELGGIIDGLFDLALAPQVGHLALGEISLVEGPYWYAPKQGTLEYGVRFGADLEVTWLGM